MIEHGLSACTVENSLAKARGLSIRTGAQPCSISHLSGAVWQYNNTIVYIVLNSSSLPVCLGFSCPNNLSHNFVNKAESNGHCQAESKHWSPLCFLTSLSLSLSLSLTNIHTRARTQLQRNIYMKTSFQNKAELYTEDPRFNDSVCYQRLCCEIEFALIKKLDMTHLKQQKRILLNTFL